MSDYIKANKQAWEEAFSESTETFKSSTIKYLKENPEKIFSPRLNTLLKENAGKDKSLVHPCCNNGRETIAALIHGYNKTVGFDIADNMVAFGNETAETLGKNASFYARNILAIEDTFNKRFDTALFTVGGITWFKDLDPLFSRIADLLKSGGTLIIEDAHPVINMLASKEEPEYDENNPKDLKINYFRDTPWIEQNSMGYMTDKSESSGVFTSYSHPLSSLINAIINAGFTLNAIEEDDVCLANLFPHLNHQGIPLTYRLIATKN